MITFEEYLKKETDEKVSEDEMVAAGTGAPSDVMAKNSVGTTASDVLGKCCHGSKGGFFGKDCNHIPKPIFKEPMKRIGKNKKQKVVMITDAELNKRVLMSLHDVKEEVISNFIKKNWNIDKDVEIAALVYYPVTKTFFGKIKIANESKSKYINFDFDETTKKFTKTRDEVMDLEYAKKIFKNILSMPGNQRNFGSEEMSLWCVWGDLN